jgi:hypothetical protein
MFGLSDLYLTAYEQSNWVAIGICLHVLNESVILVVSLKYGLGQGTGAGGFLTLPTNLLHLQITACMSKKRPRHQGVEDVTLYMYLWFSDLICWLLDLCLPPFSKCPRN